MGGATQCGATAVSAISEVPALAAASNKRRVEEAAAHPPPPTRPPPPARLTGWRRAVVTALPGAVPAVMAVAFPAARRYGPTRGYRHAFAGYWAMCLAVPTALVGPRRVADSLLRRPAGLPRPRSLALAALVVPPAGAIAVELRPHLREVGTRATGGAPRRAG